MEKKTLNFRAEEQSLIGLNAPARFASRTVSYIKAVFELGENWHGYDSVRAVWTTDFASICTVLDSFGACTVPHEVLDRVGRVYVNLVGSIAENDELTDRLTTYPLEAICIDASAVVCGSETAEITPSQFEQFADAVRSDADRAETGARDAESARADAIDARDAASASQNLASRYAVQSADSANASAQSARESADSATTSAQSAGDARESAEDAERAKDAILGMRAEAETLPAGSDATASYSDGVLSLGIPKGDTGAKGAKGDKGDTGATPDIEIGTVSTLEPGESATATITGTAERPILSLGIPKGAQGDVGMAEFLDAVTVDELSDSVPYKLKATPTNAGSREILDKIVGGTVAWNQLVDPRATAYNGITTTVSNGKFTVSGTATSSGGRTTNWTTQPLIMAKNHKYAVVSTITEPNLAGYITSKTSSSTYTSLGALRSTVINNTNVEGDSFFGFNVNANAEYNKSGYIQLFDLTQMFGSTIADYIYSLEQANAGAGVAWFKKLFPKDYYEYDSGTLKSVEGLSAHVMKDANGNVIGNYPLDNSLTLRGIPKLDSSNNLYYDGDTYASDGTVTRKYISHTFDGTESLLKLNTGTSGWYEYAFTPTPTTPNGTSINFVTDYGEAVNTFDTNNITKVIVRHYGTGFRWSMNVDTVEAAKSALMGKTIVYELATPTTETAEAYTQIQSCEDGGTEEFVTDGIVPVGNESIYPRTLADTMPRTDGTYTIGLTVSGGKRVVGWVQS